jgi:two-component system response regulator YesN
MSSVLIVDDEPLVRVSVSSMIDWSGHGVDAVHTATNGAEAISILDAEPTVSLVLLDLVMPVMDGLAFLRRLRNREARPSVVVLSSHDEYPGVREAFRLGAEDYLLKADLAPEALIDLLARTSKGKESPNASPHSSGNDLTSLQRRYLRSFLLGFEERSPLSAAKELSISLQPPMILLGFWIRDFNAVRARFDEKQIDRIGPMFLDYVSEMTGRNRSGMVVPIEPGHVTVVVDRLGDEHTAVTALVRRVEESLKHYLNVEIATARSGPVVSMEALPETYAKVCGGRPSDSRPVARAKQYIQIHYDDPELSLEEISRFVQLSRSHLSTQFHKECGKSFSDYLTEVRIEAAKQLLATSSDRVYEVAARVGYSNAEHFSRVFKKCTGLSPGKYSTAVLH